MTDDGAELEPGSTNRRKGEPGANRCDCPTNSSRWRGRIRTASGAFTGTGAKPLGPAPNALGTPAAESNKSTLLA